MNRRLIISNKTLNNLEINLKCFLSKVNNNNTQTNNTQTNNNRPRALIIIMEGNNSLHINNNNKIINNNSNNNLHHNFKLKIKATRIKIIINHRCKLIQVLLNLQ